MNKGYKSQGKARGGDLRKDATKSVIENAIQLPFQGIAQMGQGRDRMTISAGLMQGGAGKLSAGIKIKF